MKKLLLTGLLVIGAITLSGCGSAPVKLKAEDKVGLNTIAIIQPEKAPVQMINAGSGMAALGPVGGAAIGAEADSLSGQLQKRLSAHNFSVEEKLSHYLTVELKRAGYDIRQVKLKRPEEYELIESYKNINYDKADALLDTVILSAGYKTEHFMFSPYWRPSMHVKVALGRPGSEKPIYAETFMYGYHNPIMSATDVESPEKFHFDEPEEVFAAGDQMILAGLEDAAKSIAAKIAAQLAK